MVFHNENDLEDLNVSFETVLAEVDKDFSIEMEEIKKEAEEERKTIDKRIKSLYELSNELPNERRE